MNPSMQAFVTQWQALVAQKDLATLQVLLSEEVVFFSPVVFKPYQGRAVVAFLLAHVIQVFGALTYTHIYSNDEGGVVMQFQTTVDAPDRTYQVEGVDIFTLDEEGRIREMRVLLRPLGALQVVAAAMQARFVT